MLHFYFQGMFGGGHEKTRELAQQYKNMADLMNVEFLYAGDVITTDGSDDIHFTEENHITLVRAVVSRVQDLLAAGQN